MSWHHHVILTVLKPCYTKLLGFSCLAGVKRRKAEGTGRNEGEEPGRQPASRLLFRVLGFLPLFPLTPVTKPKHSLNKPFFFFNIKCALGPSTTETKTKTTKELSNIKRKRTFTQFFKIVTTFLPRKFHLFYYLNCLSDFLTF